jgi:hypothetical protein
LTSDVSEYMLLHVMWNSDISETKMLKIAKEELERRLPPGWLLRLKEQVRLLPSKYYADGILEIKTSDGTSATVLIEAKQRYLEARDVPRQVRVWRKASIDQGLSLTNEEANILVVTPYLGQSARDELAREGISFVDLTGNIRFVLRKPTVFVEAQGSNKNPLRENVPLKSLKGRRAGRVVRGLLDYQPAFGIRRLSSEIQASAASISRVVDLLEREAIINRDSPRGQILSVNWEQLLRRWIRDYNFMEANKMRTYLEPRGIPEALSKLTKVNLKYAITGSFAAARYAPITQSRLLIVYADYPEVAEERLQLRNAETGGNILLGRPFDPVVFERTETSNRLTYARVSQVAADLLTGTGRSPSEGEALIAWMKENEEKWRILLTPLT